MSEDTQVQQKSQYKDEEVGAFWKRTSQRGQKYLAGHIKDGEESVKLVVFANQNKKSDNQPDYRIYKSRPRPTEAVAETQPQEQSTNEDDLL
tara:strand:- start:362 stop:637 length:276 start_codon:yes stop_codon:yes gene_type:complete